MNLGGTVRLNRSGWIALVALVCLFLLVQYARSPSTPLVATPDADSVNNDVNAKLFSLSKLLRVAVEAARAGGEAVAAAKGEHSEVHSKGKTNEGVDLPVTAADLNSHCRMTEVIRSAFPKISLVSEEHADTCPSSQRSEPLGREDYPDLPEEYVEPKDITVWIDPLDATKEFTEGKYEYVTTMVCVAIKGVPVIGVIHKPFQKETFWTWLSKTSSQNLKHISEETQKKSPKTTKVIVSISHQGEVKNFASAVFGEDHEIISAAGAGYKVMELVHNNADVYMHKTHIKKWDTCAGNAILNYFGGKMTTLKNKLIDYSHDGSPENADGLLASMRNHDEYIEKINRVMQLPS